MTKLEKNYQAFLKVNISSYTGEWIAICNSHIVAHGKNVKKVFADAKKKYPKEEPLLAKVPKEGSMIFSGFNV